jgi:hypothetical protein
VKHSRRISKTGYGSHRQLTNGEIAEHAAAIRRLHLIAEAGTVHRHIHGFTFPKEVQDDDGHCFFRKKGYTHFLLNAPLQHPHLVFSWY